MSCAISSDNAPRDMHEIFSKTVIPKAKYERHCDKCSLKEICMPTIAKNCTTVDTSTNTYIHEKIVEYFVCDDTWSLSGKDGLNVVNISQAGGSVPYSCYKHRRHWHLDMGASPGVMKLCSSNSISLTFYLLMADLSAGYRAQRKECTVTQETVSIVGWWILVITCGTTDDWW